jgi:hypothetical protein
MADIQNVITLGIGSAPGNIRYFVLVGLDVSPVAAVITSVGPIIQGARDDVPVVQGADELLPVLQAAPVRVPVLRGAEEI